MADTIGQTVDADLAAIKAHLAALEAKAVAKEKAFSTWIKGNLLHITNSGLLVTSLLKLFGVIKL